MSHALIVVDMLVGFMEEGHPLYCGDSARSIIPYIRSLAETFGDRDDPAIFIADHHAPDDAEFDRFPPHCIAGTAESEVIAELRPFVQPQLLVPKTRYSGFFGTDLEQILETINPETVEVVGVCTNICVLYTVEELRNRDYPTIVHRRGVASFDDEAHRFALEQMASVLGAEIV